MISEEISDEDVKKTASGEAVFDVIYSVIYSVSVVSSIEYEENFTIALQPHTFE